MVLGFDAETSDPKLQALGAHRFGELSEIQECVSQTNDIEDGWLFAKVIIKS